MGKSKCLLMIKHTYGTLKTTVQNYLDTAETAFVATLPIYLQQKKEF